MTTDPYPQFRMGVCSNNMNTPYEWKYKDHNDPQDTKKKI